MIITAILRVIGVVYNIFVVVGNYNGVVVIRVNDVVIDAGIFC